MGTLKFDISDDIVSALDLEAEAFTAEVRMAAAVKLYELRKLSSGAAAQLAGVPRAVFCSRLAAYGVASFRITSDEIATDEQHA